MHAVFEKITAEIASVSIIDSKELCLDTFFLDIEGDADSVLIIISDDALMGVDRVTDYGPILFMWNFRLL